MGGDWRDVVSQRVVVLSMDTTCHLLLFHVWTLVHPGDDDFRQGCA